MKELKIIEVKSEIGAGTRGASLGVEAIKIASLDLNSDFFKQYDSVEVENVNELLFDGALLVGGADGVAAEGDDETFSCITHSRGLRMWDARFSKRNEIRLRDGRTTGRDQCSFGTVSRRNR